MIPGTVRRQIRLVRPTAGARPYARFRSKPTPPPDVSACVRSRFPLTRTLARQRLPESWPPHTIRESTHRASPAFGVTETADHRSNQNERTKLHENIGAQIVPRLPVNDAARAEA